MVELLDIRVKARSVKTEDGPGFGIQVDMNGVNFEDIIRATNTALVARGSSRRIGEVKDEE